jgi:hypothetical protein
MRHDPFRVRRKLGSHREWVRPRLRPFPIGALRDPLPPELSRRYVHCTVKPGGDSFAGFAEAARTDPAWRFDALAAGHDAMITAPDALAALLAAVSAKPLC